MKRRTTTVGTDATALDDAELFRQAVGHVRRLRQEQAPERPKPAPEPRMQARDEQEALAASRRADAAMATALGEEVPGFRHPGLPQRQFRQLRRGQFSIRDELDLHLLDSREAEALLKRFLADAVDEGLGCVRVIHGKGLRSEHGPVLRGVVERVLRQHGHVLGFCAAPAAQGGSGAMLVLLSGRRTGPS